MKRQSTYHDISLEENGKTHRARYTVSSDFVTVTWAFGQKSAMARASGAEFIARLLLRELVQDALRYGYIKAK